jgi:uncharacterized protein YhaN
LIIERLDLIAFGNFTDVSIDLSAGPRRLHLVYGPNESGKSTSLRAITSWLFGMPHTTTDDYLHPMARIRVGGRLTERDGDVLECVRRRGRRGTLRDAEDSNEIDDLVLSRMLGGIDKSTFETRFGISHAELLRGGEQILHGEGEVGEILFAAGAGIGQLQEIASKLSDEVGALFKTRGKSTINELIKDVENKRRELRDAQVPPAEFDELQQQIYETQESIERIKDVSSQFALRLGRLQAAVQALPLIPRWQAASAAFAKVATAPSLPADFPDRRRQWDQGRQLAIAKHQELARRQQSLTQQLTKLGDDPLIRAHESEIEEVYRQLATREKANQDALNLSELARRERNKVVEILAKLSGPGESNDTKDLPARVDAVRFSDSARDKIRRLASQFEKLTQQRDDAKLDIERYQRQLKAIEVKSHSTEKVDPEVLTRVLDEVGLPQRLIESATTVGEEYERWIRRCEETRDKLGVSDCFRNVAMWRLPSTDVIANAKSQFDSLEDAQVATRLRCEQTHETILEKQDRLHQLTSARSLPTIQDLSAARRDRDSLIESLAHTDDFDSMLVRLRDTVANADKIADEIQTHYGTIHQIELENVSIQSHTLKLDREKAKLAEQEAKSREAAQAWAALWSEIGVQLGSPSAMTAWIADHDRLCEFVETLEATEREKTATNRRIENACFRLQSVLGGVTDTLFPEAGDEADLAQRLHRLYDETVTLRNRVLENRKEVESKIRLHEQLKRDLEQATEQLARCQQSLDAWNVEWSTSTATLSQQKTLATDTVLDMLDWIKDLEHFLHEFNVLEKRKRSISEEYEAYKRQVVRLANNVDQGSAATASTPDGAIMEDLSLETLSSIVTSLYQRSNRERSIRESRANFARQLKECEEEMRTVDENMLRLEVVARQLCEEAGCDSTDDLVQLESRSLLRREASAELNEYASKLQFFVGDSTIEEYALSMSEVQTETLQVEIQCIESEKAAVDEQLAELQQKLGAFRHRRDLIDGGNRAADLAQSLQLDLGRIQRECQSYIRLKLAGSVLHQAIEHYRSKNQGPVLEAAESYFKKLTCGEYSALKVDYDTKGVPILQGLRGDLAVPAPMMSTGTADALYLALRLASLKHQMSHSKAIPLVIDDCLIQLDDRRVVAALEVFSELSTTTQVVLFTHHEHLIDLAQSSLSEGDFHVHRLDQLQAAV